MGGADGNGQRVDGSDGNCSGVDIDNSDRSVMAMTTVYKFINNPNYRNRVLCPTLWACELALNKYIRPCVNSKDGLRPCELASFFDLEWPCLALYKVTNKMSKV